MKNMRLLAILSFVAVFAFAACNNEGAKETTDSSETPTLGTDATGTQANPAAAVPATPAVPAGPTTSINFPETTFDFGEVMEGEVVEHVYKFTNDGNEPLIISNAKGSCGCTVPEWPKEPIPVGGSGEIMVRFDSKNKGKVGGNAQTKTVTVTANTDPGDTRLYIKGTVNKEETPSS
jgi:hypothetical protein